MKNEVAFSAPEISYGFRARFLPEQPDEGEAINAVAAIRSEVIDGYHAIVVTYLVLDGVTPLHVLRGGRRSIEIQRVNRVGEVTETIVWSFTGAIELPYDLDCVGYADKHQIARRRLALLNATPIRSCMGPL